jgi:hypothetical protein
MVEKKAQLKIQQMAFMLIATTLFFALVGIFALGFKLSGAKGIATSLQEQNAMMLATRIANSPEFSCGKSFGNQVDCVDFDKVMALTEDVSKYSEFWEISNLEIRKIYPEGNEICTLENYPNCNRILIGKEEVSGTYIPNFVSLCRKEVEEGQIYDKCELALIMVAYNKK